MMIRFEKEFLLFLEQSPSFKAIRNGKKEKSSTCIQQESVPK
jgi:hypothetical protein